MKENSEICIQELIFLIGLFPVHELLDKLRGSIEKYQITPTSENLKTLIGFASCLVVKVDFLEKGFENQTPSQQLRFLLREGEKFKELEKLMKITGNIFIETKRES